MVGRNRRFAGNFVGSMAVLAGVGAVSLGLPALDQAIPAQRPVPADRPLAVGLGVSVQPPPGASLDATGTDAFGNTVLLVVGGVRYRLKARTHTGTLSEAAARLRAAVDRNVSQVTFGQEQDTATAAGVPGRAAEFATPAGVGRYAVFVAGGVSAEVIVQGQPENVKRIDRDLDVSIASITFGPPR